MTPTPETTNEASTPPKSVLDQLRDAQAAVQVRIQDLLKARDAAIAELKELGHIRTRKAKGTAPKPATKRTRTPRADKLVGDAAGKGGQ